MSDSRWTVRGVDPQALEQLREVQDNYGWTLGDLLSEAISVWYESLPEGGDDDEDDDHQAVESDIGSGLSVMEIAREYCPQ